jgi:hypothetical protein
MADTIKGRETRTEGIIVDRVFCAGQEAAFVFGKGTQVFPNLPVPIHGCTEARTVDETDALWFEFGFKIDASLAGNAAAGFSDAGNYLHIEIEQSLDLVNWSMGKFVPAPIPVTNNGDGTYTYWSRGIVPVWWYNVLVDLTVESTRYGKSITDISIGQVTVSLPGYPYAMPSQAATLQTHLRAAGYTGAVVMLYADSWSIFLPDRLAAGNLQRQTILTFTPGDPYPGFDLFGNYTGIQPAAAVDGTHGNVRTAGGGTLAESDKQFGRLKLTTGTRYQP